MQHLEHLSVILRGRCSTSSTSRQVHGSPATTEYYGRRLLLGGSEHLSFMSRGRCSTWSISVSFCVAGAAAPGAPPDRSTEVRRRLNTIVDAGCFWVARSTSVSCRAAGAALGASQCHFAWHVQHLEDPPHICQKFSIVLIFRYLLLVVHYFSLCVAVLSGIVLFKHVFLICHYLSLFAINSPYLSICVLTCLNLSLFVFTCLYLSLFSILFPSLSLFVLVCHYLSLFVLVCNYLSLFVLHQII